MANKAQKEYAENYLQQNPNVPKLFLNAKKNEFFTDLDFANNSRRKGKDGNFIDKIEVFERVEPAEVDETIAGESGTQENGQEDLGSELDNDYTGFGENDDEQPEPGSESGQDNDGQEQPGTENNP